MGKNGFEVVMFSKGHGVIVYLFLSEGKYVVVAMNDETNEVIQYDDGFASRDEADMCYNRYCVEFNLGEGKE